MSSVGDFKIAEDLKEGKVEGLLNQEVDIDKPGCGQFYCVHCARYFVDGNSLEGHFRSKVHKQRMKQLEVEPYSQAEAERAAGMGNFQRPAKRQKVQTLVPESMKKNMEVDQKEQ